MPGQEFPRINWLDNIHFDKVAHIGLFSVLVFLWALPPRSRLTDKEKINSMYLWIAIAFVVYGIAIEFIQLNFIAHRSFDFFDIVANAIGCAFGGFVASKTSES
jgi:VanZ family protein